MSVSKPYLEINNVVKQFGQFTALKHISLSINKGEFVCFLGPSGCGKTTLLRAIAGLDLPTSGAIHQADEAITFLPPEKRDFGIVFQSYALFPNLTVQENIAIGLKNQGMSTQEALEKVEHWLEMIGLPTSGKNFLISYRAASNSVWRWLVHWHCLRVCCFWMSHFLLWMRKCVLTFEMRSVRCNANSVSPPSW